MSGGERSGRGGREPGRGGRPVRPARQARPARPDGEARPEGRGDARVAGRPAHGRDDVTAAGPGRPVRRMTPRRPLVRKPPLPEERPRVGRDAFRELKSSVPAGVLDDVIRAYGAAGDALVSDDADAALPYLDWAKAVASRSSSIREALGIAHYRRGDFATASTELTAYRRLSGRADQNHLLADCARAAGRHDRVEELVDELVTARGVGAGRVAEGLMVLAGDHADRDDLRGAMAVLERIDLAPARVEDWHPRAWYAAADIAERQGDTDRVRDLLEAVVSVDADFLDAAERLQHLEDAP